MGSLHCTIIPIDLTSDIINSNTVHNGVYLNFYFLWIDVGMVAIIVVCVGFLLFMIILGVIRIRAAHRRTQVVQVEPEMEWDNDMNIIVNPMEQETHPLHVSVHREIYILRKRSEEGSGVVVMSKFGLTVH